MLIFRYEKKFLSGKIFFSNAPNKNERERDTHKKHTKTNSSGGLIFTARDFYRVRGEWSGGDGADTIAIYYEGGRQQQRRAIHIGSIFIFIHSTFF
jgi:hypothetical protein